MSEKMTRLELPGHPASVGLMNWGERTPEEMIQQVRAYADSLRATVDAIDDAKDSEFQIDLVRGPIVQHFIRTLQASSKTGPDAPPHK